MRENHITREIDVGGDVLCVWEIYTLHSVCAWVREIAGDLESEGEMCACPRDKVIETYVGVRTLEERGVLMCSCVGVWGRERLLYVCVCGGGGGGGVDFR